MRAARPTQIDNPVQTKAELQKLQSNTLVSLYCESWRTSWITTNSTDVRCELVLAKRDTDFVFSLDKRVFSRPHFRPTNGDNKISAFQSGALGSIPISRNVNKVRDAFPFKSLRSSSDLIMRIYIIAFWLKLCFNINMFNFSSACLFSFKILIVVQQTYKSIQFEQVTKCGTSVFFALLKTIPTS